MLQEAVSPAPFASLKHHKMAHWGLLVAMVPLKFSTAANLCKCTQKDRKAKFKDWLFVKISLFPVMFLFIIEISRWYLNDRLISTGIKVIFSQCWLFFFFANKIWRGSCFLIVISDPLALHSSRSPPGPNFLATTPATRVTSHPPPSLPPRHPSVQTRASSLKLTHSFPHLQPRLLSSIHRVTLTPSAAALRPDFKTPATPCCGNPEPRMTECR